MAETTANFEHRKRSHMELALRSEVQTLGKNDLPRIHLIHEALPNFNFEQVDTRTELWGLRLRTPLLISSMTAGHPGGEGLNVRLAKAAQAKGWMMGVGSQRRQLFDSQAASEWKLLRKEAPSAILLGNIGVTQVIQTPVTELQKLVESLEAKALFVHLNPLQEALQPEGTPQFKGALPAIEKLVKELGVPVVIKEVGCGISALTAKRLQEVGVQAIDVAGLGGTHWGRIEGLRAKEQSKDHSIHYGASLTFGEWGIPVVQSLLEVKQVCDTCQVWASGGVRSGLDAAKLLALGASIVGIAKPLLEALIVSEERLHQVMEQIELELRLAQFCTGSEKLADLNLSKVEGLSHL